MKKTLTLSILLVGLSSMASQVVLLREFLIIFHGNELSIGLILGLWLFLGAIGSGLLGLFVDRISNKVLTIAICQFLLSALFPLTLVLTRLIRPILGVSPAEMIGIFPLLLSGTLILAPICIIFGFLFSLNCKAIGSGARGVGYVYILEAVGSSVGGLLISLVLIKYLNSLTIVAVLSTLNLALSVYLLSKSEKQTLLRTILFGFNILLILAFVFLFSTNRINSINDDLVKLQWKPYQLLDSENSIYGNVVVVEEKNQISFFDNGLHLFSVPDRLSSEEQVHFAMLMHPNPRKILVVGGGVGGVLNEILKYGVDRIDYVELDPLIIQMANTYLRKNELEILEDSRVNIKHIDGRFFIKKADIKYDCIIMNVPEPSTAGINRLYTQEFFKELRAVLSDGGIVSFGLTSAENYIGRELKDFLSCIHKTLRSVFEDVKVIPGDTAYFLSSNKEGILTYNYEALSRRIETWGIDIRFVREYYLVSRMSSERVSYIENR